MIEDADIFRVRALIILFSLLFSLYGLCNSTDYIGVNESYDVTWSNGAHWKVAYLGQSLGLSLDGLEKNHGIKVRVNSTPYDYPVNQI